MNTINGRKIPNRCFACSYLQKAPAYSNVPRCTFGQQGLVEAKFSVKNIQVLTDMGKYVKKCLWIK